MTSPIDTIFPQPFYYIAFSIVDEHGKDCAFQSLFSNEPGSLKSYLEREAQGFRYGGWGLPRNVEYTIQLNGIEYADNSRRVKILESGQIIIQGSVSEAFLCWASSNRQSTLKGDRIQINTTALTEFTYNCVSLLSRALQDCENPRKVTCEFGFVGMDNNYVLGDEKLPGQTPFTHSWNMNPIGSETEAIKEIETPELAGKEGMAKLVYFILARVYRMFGFIENVISYTHVDGGKIDIDLIRGIK